MLGTGKYRLYGWRQTGSMAPEAAFAEAGVEYDFVPISRKTNENLTEDYRKINPRQQLPALMLPDGTIMTEGAAMLLHIGDAFSAVGLIPKPGSSAPSMIAGSSSLRSMFTKANCARFAPAATQHGLTAPKALKLPPMPTSSATFKSTTIIWEPGPISLAIISP